MPEPTSPPPAPLHPPKDWISSLRNANFLSLFLTSDLSKSGCQIVNKNTDCILNYTLDPNLLCNFYFTLVCSFVKVTISKTLETWYLSFSALVGYSRAWNSYYDWKFEPRRRQLSNVSCCLSVVGVVQCSTTRQHRMHCLGCRTVSEDGKVGRLERRAGQTTRWQERTNKGPQNRNLPSTPNVVKAENNNR